jgi:EAL domain-containing protein (putative c-di-GMP-specific phosphodiesterase class I)
MSPLLTTRPSVSVTLRLIAACAVTALAAAIVPLFGADSSASAAVPAGLAVGIVCAALVSHLLYTSARATDDQRLIWLSAGTTLALAGLVTTLFALPSLFADGPVATTAESAAARYLFWHAALAGAGVLALAGARPTPGALLSFGGLGALLLAWAAVDPSPLGLMTSGDGGFSPTMRALLALLVTAQAGVAVTWWRRAGRALSWSDMCVLALLALSTLDMLAYALAPEQFIGTWWASLALRAGQFAVPAVGLLLGFIAVADRLREFEDELAATLVAERDRVRDAQERASLDERRRERVRARMRRMIAGEGVDVAFQPIVDLGSGRVVGAEALARSTAADGAPIPTERCFLDAHAVDLGIELELAVIGVALRCEHRLPDGRYLALNVSPAVLERDELARVIAEHGVGRPLVVEITEHQPVDDYAALSASLDRLRALGARVAVDDVGSGFASFRHVTRVNPDILKLDRTLVCGIDDDPVRQSLASAIVAFAADVGATVVSEGIESASELSCLRELDIACGQGYYLARPHVGSVAPECAELLRAAWQR